MSGCNQVWYVVAGLVIDNGSDSVTTADKGSCLA